MKRIHDPIEQKIRRMPKGFDSVADQDDDDDDGAGADQDDDAGAGAAADPSPDPDLGRGPDPAPDPVARPPSTPDPDEILSDIKATEMMAEEGGAGASLPADNRGALARILRR